MNYQEKSTTLMTAAMMLVYGVYFFIIWRWHGAVPLEEIAYQPLLMAAVIPLIMFAVAGHVLIALFNPREASVEDERDRQIALYGERAGGMMLGVTMFCGIVLSMLDTHHFYVANALMLGWVLAEILEGLTKIVLYRRGSWA